MKQKISGDAFLGERIREYREIAGLSQSELAARCGWKSHARISLYETGKRMPPIKCLKTLASELEISLEWLCFGSGDALDA